MSTEYRGRVEVVALLEEVFEESKRYLGVRS